jgi:hypothetical protein
MHNSAFWIPALEWREAVNGLEEILGPDITSILKEELAEASITLDNPKAAYSVYDVEAAITAAFGSSSRVIMNFLRKKTSQQMLL